MHFCLPFNPATSGGFVAEGNALRSCLLLMTIDTQMTLALLQELLMARRKPADYLAMTNQLSQRILPTTEAALDDLSNLIEDTELNAGTCRNLIGAQKELGRACASLCSNRCHANGRQVNVLPFRRWTRPLHLDDARCCRIVEHILQPKVWLEELHPQQKQ